MSWMSILKPRGFLAESVLFAGFTLLGLSAAADDRSRTSVAISAMRTEDRDNDDDDDVFMFAVVSFRRRDGRVRVRFASWLVARATEADMCADVLWCRRVTHDRCHEKKEIAFI